MTTDRTTETKGTGKYAEVNGINLYYEIHGAGRPLILLHGGLGSGEMFGPVLPQLAKRHQVIAVDLQGHGRTADIDRPLDVRLMADDIGALISHLGLTRPDVMGFSLGGGVALLTAVKYPDLVGKLIVVSANIRRSAIYVEVFALLDGGLRDGGWQSENRPKGGHALAILPGLTHYNIADSPLLAATALAFLDPKPS